MSKLETAFSKAMEEQKKAAMLGEPLDAINSSTSPAVRKSHAGEITSSRKQIAKMKQETVFTEEQLAAKKLIYPGIKDAKLLNIYRNIRTKLLAFNGKRNFTTLVTSVVPGGGSSLVSANIANVFAFDEGKTALLVDANVHAPALAEIFDVKETHGLIDFLESENMDVNDVLKPTGIPRLRFVPTGTTRENSTEYFTSSRMQHFIQEILDRYPERYPIIDSPSVADSADTRILIDLCDQVVLVVPYGQCSEAEIKTAARTIGQQKLAGVVLNQF